MTICAVTEKGFSITVSQCDKQTIGSRTIRQTYAILYSTQDLRKKLPAYTKQTIIIAFHGYCIFRRIMRTLEARN